MNKADLKKLKKICDSIRKDNNLWQYPSIEAKVVQAERLVEKANSPKSWDAAYKVIKGQEAVISSEIRGVENGSDEGDLKALYSFRRRLRAAAEKLRKINPLNAKDGVRAKDGKEKQIARGIGWEVYYHDGRYYVDYFNGKPIGGHKTLQGAKEELYYAGKIPSKTAELKGDYTKDAETHYLINGKVFRTQEEAEGYEKLYRKKTGVFLAIERTNRAVTHTFEKNAKDAISPDSPDVIKVTTRYPDYIDFIIGSDKQNLYRYEKATGKMRKILGVGKGNFGNAIRGIDRKKVESVAKIVFERKLPFAVIA